MDKFFEVLKRLKLDYRVIILISHLEDAHKHADHKINIQHDGVYSRIS